MKINLPTDTFSFFKFASGTIFLIIALFSPLVAIYSFFVALTVGRAHGLGAWLAMWRAGKLNWKYVSWMTVIILMTSFWGLKLVSSTTLLFVTYFFFAIHFFFDEFDLQEETRTMRNILSGISPLLLVCLFLIQGFLGIHIPLPVFVAIAMTFVALEMIHLQEVNWFFLHTKILAAFILASMYLGSSAKNILDIFLVFHYFFWFAYPVYKLHKYKPAERDGFIMMLVLLIGAGIYFATTRSSYGPDVLQFSIRIFMVGTLIHIFSTAPFGYMFGLPKPKAYPPVTTTT